MERKVRRVQVTASVPGASEPVGQIAAPAELRTPTSMELKLAHGKCGWKRGDSANRDQQATKTGLPFPPSLLYGSQPPAKAALRLASLGLDRAWLRSEGKCPKRRKWQGFGLAYGRSNTRRSAPDTVLKTNELTNLLTRPAFSWKGRNRTADASLFPGLLTDYAKWFGINVS